jgi:hypothetical protein
MIFEFYFYISITQCAEIKANVTMPILSNKIIWNIIISIVDLISVANLFRKYFWKCCIFEYVS